MYIPLYDNLLALRSLWQHRHHSHSKPPNTPRATRFQTLTSSTVWFNPNVKHLSTLRHARCTFYALFLWDWRCIKFQRFRFNPVDTRESARESRSVKAASTSMIQTRAVNRNTACAPPHMEVVSGVDARFAFVVGFSFPSHSINQTLFFAGCGSFGQISFQVQDRFGLYRVVPKWSEQISFQWIYERWSPTVSHKEFPPFSYYTWWEVHLLFFY